MTARLWAYVVSWNGHEEESRAIASALVDHVDRLVVIYSNAAERTESGAGEWLQVPNSYYYAEKFATAVAHFDGDVMMHVHADARCSDWAALASRCRAVFTDNPRMGVWHPLTQGAAMPPHLTELPSKLRRDEVGPGLTESIAAENVVWALSQRVTDRFRGLDLSSDHYGWGVVDAVCAVSHAQTLDLVIDRTVSIDHEAGRGYDTGAASSARYRFVRDFLTPDEFRMWQLVGAAVQARGAQDVAESQLDACSRSLASLRHRTRHLRMLLEAARLVRPARWRTGKEPHEVAG